MQAAHHLDARAAGRHRLAAAREAGHQMRLDQPGDDLEIGADQAAVEPDLRTTLRPPEVHVLGDVARVVVADAIACDDVGADHLRQLVDAVGAMQPGGDEDLDALAGDAGALERLQQRRQHDGVGDRPRLVGDDDDGIAAPARQLGQGLAADRLRERRRDRRGRIVERRSLRRLEHRNRQIVRQPHVEPSAPIVESNVHARHLAKRSYEG